MLFFFFEKKYYFEIQMSILKNNNIHRGESVHKRSFVGAQFTSTQDAMNYESLLEKNVFLPLMEQGLNLKIFLNFVSYCFPSQK